MSPILAVEIDLFSGRPNPHWQMSFEESAQFLSLLANLPETDGGHPPDALGYRGMVVSSVTGTVIGYDRVVCYRGFVFAHYGEVVKVFLDRDRALERWVAQRVGPHVASDLQEFLTEEGLR